MVEIKDSLENGTSIEVDGVALKRCLGVTIDMVGGENSKATFFMVAPIIDIECDESYSFLDLSDYPVDVLVELREMIDEDLESRKK